MVRERALDEAFPARLKAHRELSGLSVEALAAMLGVTPYTIKQWETGAWRPLSSRLQGLADALGVTYVQLVQAPPIANVKILDPQSHLARGRIRRLLLAFNQCERLDQDVLIHLAERMTAEFGTARPIPSRSMKATAKLDTRSGGDFLHVEQQSEQTLEPATEPNC